MRNSTENIKQLGTKTNKSFFRGAYLPDQVFWFSEHILNEKKKKTQHWIWVAIFFAKQ